MMNWEKEFASAKILLYALENEKATLNRKFMQERCSNSFS